MRKILDDDDGEFTSLYVFQRLVVCLDDELSAIDVILTFPGDVRVNQG
jgi:hypothetical protein